MRIFSLLLVLLSCTNAIRSQVTFPEYADLLVESYYSKANVHFTNSYGGRGGDFPLLINPNRIIGPNAIWFLSLPTGSYVIVKFTDNVVIDKPGQPDLFITENGCSGEKADVYVSEDGKDFIKLGVVDDCKTSSLDLSAIAFKGKVQYVKIVGLDMNGQSPGYDLVSVKGLRGSNINTYVNPDSLDSFLTDTTGTVSKKIVLEDILFDYNSAILLPVSKSSLDTLASKLLIYRDVEIKLTGHTDDTGSEEFNLNLSIQRAKSVKEYLVSKGVDQKRISFSGKGESEPLRSNATEEGRMVNRRVEFEKTK